MRNLIVHRVKSFVGCLGKLKVYIEDSETGELDINGVLCRKIGELKNGEEKTFSITEQAVRVYVIAGKSSRNYCNDFCLLPEGSEDVVLTGKNQYNPACGNPFRFEGVHSEDVLQNRKKTSRRGNVILIVSCLLGIAIGLAVTLLPKEETFAADEMRITLQSNFVEVEQQNMCASYGTKDVAVFVIKDTVAEAPELAGLALEEYGQMILDINQSDESVVLQKLEGLTYFEYIFSNPETGEDWYYFSVVYKSQNAYWLVQFATLEKNMEQYAQSFVQWAKSVEFVAA